MTTAEEKKEARIKILSERRALDSQYIREASIKIAECFLDLAITTHANTVLLFYPIKNEPELLSIVKVLRYHSVTVGFPISLTDSLSLDFRVVDDVADMSLGAYGICEPRQNARSIRISKNTLCVVPALAFDKSGYRLGYGKGYYDRFLSTFEGISVGVTFEKFVLDTLPRGEFDLPVDLIITEGGVMIPNEADKKIIHPEANLKG